MLTALLLLAALLLDLVLGDPRRWHPLAGFGHLAHRFESCCYGDSRSAGVVALLVVVLPFVLLTLWLPGLGVVVWPVEVLLLYFSIGATSLAQHGQRVAEALTAGDLPLARERVGWIVSRDTAQLDEQGVARAACESVLENGNDAVFGVLFWFVLLGLPGAVLYRLVNTLDAMWGYRTKRYRHFGWAAARFDDLLNFLPARLTALSYALLGNLRNALYCWRTQAHLLESPNGGPVMSAGAGALGVCLGGPAIYHGEAKAKPWFGAQRSPDADDIVRAIRLVQRAVLLWLLIIILGGLFVG